MCISGLTDIQIAHIQYRFLDTAWVTLFLYVSESLVINATEDRSYVDKDW